jgi:hypothetical protein
MCLTAGPRDTGRRFVEGWAWKRACVKPRTSAAASTRPRTNGHTSAGRHSSAGNRCRTPRNTTTPPARPSVTPRLAAARTPCSTARSAPHRRRRVKRRSAGVLISLRWWTTATRKSLCTAQSAPIASLATGAVTISVPALALTRATNRRGSPFRRPGRGASELAAAACAVHCGFCGVRRP